MRRSLLPLLPWIGLVLMGNSCDFAARVGTPPPPPEADRPVEGDGLLVVVRAGDTTRLDEAQASAATEALVAAALGVSALSVPEPATVAWSSSSAGAPPLTRIEPVIAIPAPIVESRPVGAIPEPGGWLVFACGFAACAGRLGRNRSRPARSTGNHASDAA